MFEAVVLTCALLSPDACREALVPGFAAATEADCAARLTAAGQEGRCKPAGQPLDVTEVAPGIFVHLGQVAVPNPQNRGDVSNMGFVIGQTGVAVIDTGGAAWIGEALWRSIRARTDLPVTHVILTHMHPDHIFGTRVFEAAGAEVVGHARLERAILDRRQNYLTSLERLVSPKHFAGSAAPSVTQEIEAEGRIDLGGRSLRVQAWDSAHSVADLTVLDEATGTLFAGDLVFHRHAPALDGSLRGWQAVLAELSETEVRRIIPGHGGPVLAWPSGFGDTARYLDTLARDTSHAINQGHRLGQAVEEIGEDEAAEWDLFDDYNKRNATQAFTELEWE